MPRNPDDCPLHETDPANDAPVLERVEELTWAAIDEVASDDEIRLLETLLLSDDEAVTCHAECAQLHVDLLKHFADEPDETSLAGDSLVLGFLNEGTPPLGTQPDLPQDSRS